jgi:hypothetical protein
MLRRFVQAMTFRRTVGSDLEIEGIRYLQWPLGYFREANLQCAPIHSTGPLVVHDTALGAGKLGTARCL